MKESFYNWLGQLDKSETIPNSIVALNFGIFETTENYTIYLIGSEKYDVEDDDWATEVGYEPKDKYLLLPDSKEYDWQEIQSKVENFLIEFIGSEKYRNSIFSNVENITIGFDDGELKKLK
jgi:hypothetical protein